MMSKLLVFARRLRRKEADVPDTHFTLPDPAGKSPTLVQNETAKTKERGSWVLVKKERQKRRRLFTQGGVAYGSVRNLVKTSTLPVSKVRQVLHSEPSYTKFTPAMGKNKKMKAIARFEIEI